MGRRGRAEADESARSQVPTGDLSLGRTGSSAAEDTTTPRNPSGERSDGQSARHRTCHNGPRTSGVASGESWGRLARTKPRSHAAHRDRPGRRARTGCYGSSTPLTSISAPATTTSASRRPRSASGSSRRSRRAVDLALAEKVDLFLIAGDLFDSNVQPRRSVERVAAELKRLVDARIRTVIIPGTHDVYDRASIYRAYDLTALAGSTADDDFVTVLDPDLPYVHLPASTSSSTAGSSPRSARRTSPLDGFVGATATASPATWRIGMVHGSIAIPGKTDRDEVVITTDEIAASGLDYLALGHWHSAQAARPAR